MAKKPSSEITGNRQPRWFVSDHLGLYFFAHDINGLFLERESFRLGAATYRSGSTRRRRRDRWSGHAMSHDIEWMCCNFGGGSW